MTGVGHLLVLAMSALGSSELVQIERYRLAGVAVSAVASTVAAVLAYRNGREAREAKREALRARRAASRRRHAVRDPDRERVLVVDEAEPERER